MNRTVQREARTPEVGRWSFRIQQCSASTDWFAMVGIYHPDEPVRTGQARTGHLCQAASPIGL